MFWWQRWPKHEPADSERSESTPLKSSESPQYHSEPVILEVTDVLDLHVFAPPDVGEVVEAYLEEAYARGFTQVRIIHGKGIGVQRERVRAILRRTPWVVHYEESPPEAGSWGATVAWLRAHDV
jgi:dsDNA-specific endonuclease/ATPase MutS2